MRAIVMRTTGGPDVLEVEDVPEPRPGEVQLLVRVEAAGVNFREAGSYAERTAVPAAEALPGICSRRS